MTDANTESPCIGTCSLDAQAICTGCGRSVEEIAAWAGLAGAARLAVLEAARARRDAMRAQSSASRS